MSDHLPECPMSNGCKHDYYNDPPIQCSDCGESCICDRLRACEKRVLDAIDLPAANVQYQKVGYADGLDAAREAVAALPEVAGWTGELAIIRKSIALAAIDALREQS